MLRKPRVVPETSAIPSEERGGSPLSNLNDVLNGLSSASLWQERVYKDLHAHPELSYQETGTAALAAAKLKELGYEVLEQIGRTGVVGVLRNGTGQTVLARADMDALPVKERTGLPYASTLTATDDTGASVPVMHACGHDAHVTCLLGAAELLARARRSWSGTFVAVFQPAEEVAGGAKAMVKDGLRDRIPKPDVAFAQHVLAYPAGTVGTQVGPVLSAGDSIRITLHGKGAHGSMPHNSVDPVVLAALVVLRLQTIVSRETKPGEFAVLTVGSSVAGAKSNIIPEHAVLLANLRTYDLSVRKRMIESIERMVNAECEASGAPKPRSSTTTISTHSPITTPTPRSGPRPRSEAISRPARSSTSAIKPPAKTSAISRTPWARPIPTGESAESAPTNTPARARPGGWNKTSPSIIRSSSRRSSSRRCPRAHRLW